MILEKMDMCVCIYIYVCVCVFSICTYHLYVCAHLGTRVRTRVRDAVSQGWVAES